MNLIRHNIFHIVTVLLFTGLIFHSSQSSDALGWSALFILIIFNAVLFILKKPLSMISWFVIVIGILGLLMCLPYLFTAGIEYFKGKSVTGIRPANLLETVGYFFTSLVFSLFQIRRLIR